MRRVLLLIVTLVTLFIATPSQALFIRDIGTGSDVSFLYIQFSAEPENSVLFRYSYNYSESSQITGAQLIFNIVNTAGSLFNSVGDGTITLGGTFFASEFEYNGFSESGDWTTPESWNYFTSGGLNIAYYPESFDPIWGPGGEGDYTFVSVAGEVWGSSSVGSAGHVITPGSWDAWTYGAWPGPPPTISPVPEPSAYLLIISGVAVFAFLRQIRRVAQ